jgi:hypothetical protein
MRKKTPLALAITCFAGLTAVGCGFPDIPTGVENPVEVSLDFCADEIPIWFAVQNGTQPVNVIPHDGNGTFTFTATRRVTLAFVRENGSDYRTEIISTSSNDLEPLSDDVCVEDAGAKTVNGTVAGVTGSQVALVGMSSRSALLTAGQTSFSLTQLADRPLDLVASRFDVDENTQHANTTIIRRALTFSSGSSLAAINFDAEGFPAGLHSLSANGIEPEVGSLVNTFISQQETSHTLSVVDSIPLSGSVPFMAIPEAQMVGGEYHEAVLLTTNDAAYTRGAKAYFRDPGILTLTLGSAIADPTVTLIASEPYTRMQATLNGQLDYARVVVADFVQQTPASTIEVSVTVTASFFGGTPVTWLVPIPDFTGISGWNNAWGLQSGSSVDWTVSAHFISPRLLFGDRPVAGESARFASRSSSIAAAQAFRARQGHSRSRLFSRLH